MKLMWGFLINISLKSLYKIYLLCVVTISNEICNLLFDDGINAFVKDQIKSLALYNFQLHYFITIQKYTFLTRYLYALCILTKYLILISIKNSKSFTCI